MNLLGKMCVGSVMATALVLFAACQEESDNVKVKVKENGSNLCAEFAEVTCRNYFECCQGVKLEEYLGVNITTTESTCRGDVELVCERSLSPVLYGVEKGRTSVLVENIDDCLTQMIVGDDGCFPYVSDPWPACDAVFFRGTQGEGKACLTDLECNDSTYCGKDRKCRARGGKNDLCDDYDMPCGAAYYCGRDADIDPENDVCLTLIEVGDPCSDSDECEKGLICIPPEEGEPRECTSPKKLGDKCDMDGVCKSGLCLAGLCDDDRICDDTHPCSGTCSESGASCTSDASCGGQCSASGNSCQDDEECYYGTCEGSDELCLYTDGCMGTCAVTGGSCYDDSYCDTADASDVCDAPECVRETCESDQACEGSSPCKGRVCAEDFFVLDYCEDSPIVMMSEL